MRNRFEFENFPIVLPSNDSGGAGAVYVAPLFVKPDVCLDLHLSGSASCHPPAIRSSTPFYKPCINKPDIGTQFLFSLFLKFFQSNVPQPLFLSFTNSLVLPWLVYLSLLWSLSIFFHLFWNSQARSSVFSQISLSSLFCYHTSPCHDVAAKMPAMWWDFAALSWAPN